MNEQMRYSAPIRFIFGATSKAMKYHLKGCLENFHSDAIILQHGANDMKGDSTSEDLAIDTINLAVAVKNEKNTLYVSSLIITNDKHDKKQEVNEHIKKHYLSKHMLYIDTEIVILGMLKTKVTFTLTKMA